LKSPLKRILPKTLFGRALLIIVLPVAILQIIVVYIFFNAHWLTVTANLSDSVAADVSLAVELYKEDPGAEKALALDELMRPNMELSVDLRNDAAFLTAKRRSFFSILDKTLQRSLNEALTDEFWFDTTRYPNHIDIRVKVDDGAAKERVFARTGFVFIFWLVLASFILALVSILFIRNQAKPITQLAAAADSFGKGQDIADFKPSGAAEVRLAGQSFLKMRRRISRFMDQRTELLAGVSHDLRTPLTRLNLHLAMQEDSEENRAARGDLKDMESMLNGYLDFARGQMDEESETVSLNEFLSSILSKYESPNLELKIGTDREILVKTTLMERAVTNLISNAQKYGDQIVVETSLSDSNTVIAIEDNGPGIPEDKLDEVFRPFYRLDSARNQNIEGTGLGLSIARDIIRNHGGTIGLMKASLGGLRAEIRLPI